MKITDHIKKANEKTKPAWQLFQKHFVPNPVTTVTVFTRFTVFDVEKPGPEPGDKKRYTG